MGFENKEKNLMKEKLSNLLDKRKIYECSLVAIFYKDSNLYFEKYEMTKSVIKNKIWFFYFELGNKIIEKGYKEINQKNIILYLENNSDDKETFEKFGGYEKIEPIINTVDVANFEAFFLELQKSAIIYENIRKTYLTDKMVNNLLGMTTTEIQNFLSLRYDDVLSTSLNDDRTQRNLLNENLQEIIETADKGENQGLPIKSEILNYEIGGLRQGDLILVGASSGVGKSTFTQEVYLSALWEQEESVVIFLNEQDHIKWKQQFLTWIVNNIILKDSNKKFNSKRWIQGFFTEEEREWLFKAKELLETKTKNNLIQLVEFERYSMKRLIEEVKKYHKLGIRYFALDTFKLSSDTISGHNDIYWLSMQEDMRALYDIVKPAGLNINFWVTLQLDKASFIKRYITRTDIGMSKNIIDVGSVIIFLRNIHNDEYQGNRAIEVRKPCSLDNIGVGEKVELLQGTNYTVTFIDKNRNGSSGMYQIVSRHNLGTLEWEEKGITQIPFGT